MTISMLDDDTWVVQAQRQGIRKTRRGRGGVGAARAAEKRLLLQVATELDARKRQEQMLAPVAPVAPVVSPPDPYAPPPGEIMTLREFYDKRWPAHARVMQNTNTSKLSRSKWNYLLHYLGDEPLAECVKPRLINRFIEDMLQNPPLSFKLRRDGKPYQRKLAHLSKATVNHCLVTLKTALYLAYKEELIPVPPDIELLRPDDQHVVLAPTEAQFKALLRACQAQRTWAPLLPEVVELTALTGMRRNEVFNLSWDSVDRERGIIRIETQGKVHSANGKYFRPKHGRIREIPLSVRARALLDIFKLHNDPQRPHLVVPSIGGSPYYPVYRDDLPERGHGKGYFYDAVLFAGLKGKVTFHALRHLFAVRLLSRGVPMAVVSDLLGHANVNLSVKIYGKFAPDAQVKFDAVKVLDSEDAIFGGQIRHSNASRDDREDKGRKESKGGRKDQEDNNGHAACPAEPVFIGV